MVAGALLAALVAGLLPHPSAPLLWLIAVLVSGFLLRRAFPTMWLYSVWLVAVYALSLVGAGALALFAAGISPLVGGVPLPLLLTAVTELLALYVALALFAEVKSIRDFRTRLSIARGDSPPEYRRIGLWAVALVLFFLLANLSAIFFVGWVRGSGAFLPAYAVVEGLLIGVGLYLVWVPEASFGQLPAEYRQAIKEPSREPSIVSVIAARARARAAGVESRKKKGAPCPACGRALEQEGRECPNCGASRTVGWCPSSEVHVTECPSCSRPVIYGKPVCPHCKAEVPEALACSSCKAHAPLRDWMRKAAA